MIYGLISILHIYICIFFYTNFNDDRDGKNEKENEGQEVYYTDI